jgi:hypothetical protein
MKSFDIKGIEMSKWVLTVLTEWFNQHHDILYEEISVGKRLRKTDYELRTAWKDGNWRWNYPVNLCLIYIVRFSDNQRN